MRGGDTRSSSPFSRVTVFAVVAIGFFAFIALLYFLGAGDTGERRNSGQAHAAATGLNGYAGLVRMLEKEGVDVRLSRTPSGLETADLLVLTPSVYSDPEEIGSILVERRYAGPTLVILPKWNAMRPPRDLPDEVADQFKEGWVHLTSPTSLDWTERLPRPFAFERSVKTLRADQVGSWSGLGGEGQLPTNSIAYADDREQFEALVTDAANRTLAHSVTGDQGTDYNDMVESTIFVTEPDLMNNYGLADADRAKAALALVRQAGYGDVFPVVFDLTLNGFGGAENLLTLAFRPPFLAATLCLILALLIIGWRAFLRFGPAAASAPEIAFGKKRLIGNGAALIVRAKRLRLLAEPYADLSARRLARIMGLSNHDPDAIDAALETRLPNEEPYSVRAQRLRGAHSPSEILRAAQALKELEGKLSK